MEDLPFTDDRPTWDVDEDQLLDELREKRYEQAEATLWDDTLSIW